jgi:hypothetical protein
MKEVNYKGRGRYCPGRMRRDRGDGTYDIEYDDGETELRVKEDMIKVLESKCQPSSGMKGGIKKGMKVEVDYGGRDRYFPGTIRRVRGDGTYDIE